MESVQVLNSRGKLKRSARSSGTSQEHPKGLRAPGGGPRHRFSRCRITACGQETGRVIDHASSKDKANLRRSPLRRAGGQSPTCTKVSLLGRCCGQEARTGGRNNAGPHHHRHQGGGHKKRYRVIDFKRNKDGIPAQVERLEYDPNRSAHLALLLYADGERRYIIAPKGCDKTMQVMSGSDVADQAGNACRCGTFRWVRSCTVSR